MKHNSILTILLLLIALNTSAQSRCWFDDTKLKNLKDDPFTAKSHKSLDQYTVRLFVHIVNKCDGTCGLSVQNMLDNIATLKQDFEPHGICFSLMGYEFVDAPSFFTCGIPG